MNVDETTKLMIAELMSCFGSNYFTLGKCDECENRFLCNLIAYYLFGTNKFIFEEPPPFLRG